MRQVEFLATREGDRYAKHAACVLQHEVHLFRSYLLGCDDEVALILAVFVVNHDYELSGFKIFESVFDAAQFEFSHSILGFMSRQAAVAGVSALTNKHLAQLWLVLYLFLIF